MDEIIYGWQNEIKEKIQFHKRLAISTHKKYIVTGLIPIILPILLGAVIQINEDQDQNELIGLMSFSVITIVNSLDKFFSYKSKSIQNDFACQQYETLLSVLEIRLAKEEKDNNLFVLVQTELKNLAIYSPNGYSLCTPS